MGGFCCVVPLALGGSPCRDCCKGRSNSLGVWGGHAVPCCAVLQLCTVNTRAHVSWLHVPTPERLQRLQGLAAAANITT